MQNRFEWPVSITNRASIGLQAWLWLIHLGAVPTLALSGLPGWGLLAILPAVFASLYFSLRRYVFLNSPASIVRLFLNEKEEWWLTTSNERTFKAKLLPPALVHPLLTVLRFRAGRDNYTLILAPDSARPDELRRLRVRLRFPRNKAKCEM